MPDQGKTIPTVTREEILRRAEALVPVLRERSPACEAARRCPDETMADFDAAGFLRICQPARFGGLELGWDVLCEVGQILARGCGAQAWVATVMGDHAQIASGFPLEAQEEIWGNDPGTRLCASFPPIGIARSVAGGVRFTGKHGFSSGVDHAHWALPGGTIVDGPQVGERCLFLIPKHEITVIDDWRVMGMAGTGSKSFTVEDAFVPSHRILRYSDLEAATGPGNKAHASPLFRMPHGGLATSAFACVAVGIAEGFLDEYMAMTRKRVSRGVKVAEQTGTHISLAVASAEIEAAAALYMAPVREARAMLERGETVPAHYRARGKRNSTYAARTALAAVERLFYAAGSRVLFEGNALQRAYRDLHATATHTGLIWDVGMSEYGQHLLESEQG
jgi:3-hydroxy-9,10-secoandrosta-1,3,5(10)-triene-9,17-dione monooxygenase